MTNKNQQPRELGISEAELAAMTSDLDQMHRDSSLPALTESVDEWVSANKDEETSSALGGASRRTFLLGTGAAAVGGLLLAACGSSGSSSSSTTAAGGATGAKYPANLTGDLKVAALAASLENLAVYTYTAGIKAATAGKLGTVPPAIVTFATTARSQHMDHAAAWNAVLTGAGKTKVTETDPVLTPVIQKMFAKVTDVTGLAELALEVEEGAGATYQSGIGALSSPKGVAAAASIQPVELQHAAILLFVLGQYPVPNAFSPTSSARPLTDLNT